MNWLLHLLRLGLLRLLRLPCGAAASAAAASVPSHDFCTPRGEPRTSRKRRQRRGKSRTSVGRSSRSAKSRRRRRKRRRRTSATAGRSALMPDCCRTISAPGPLIRGHPRRTRSKTDQGEAEHGSCARGDRRNSTTATTGARVGERPKLCMHAAMRVTSFAP